jgi:hypothetical protein
MANHNKNKRFSGDNFQPVRKARMVGSEQLERQLQRKLERGNLRPLPENDYDLLIDYSNEE